jgi:hypothetical protein
MLDCASIHGVLNDQPVSKNGKGRWFFSAKSSFHLSSLACFGQQ